MQNLCINFSNILLNNAFALGLFQDSDAKVRQNLLMTKYFLKFFINKDAFMLFCLKICFITCFQGFQTRKLHR